MTTCAHTSLLPTDELWGKVIFSEACVKNSVHGGWYPCRSQVGGVSQHALQVSRPTPKGKLRGLAGGSLGLHPEGGSPDPHPGGGL